MIAWFIHVDPTPLTGNAVSAWCFQAEAILDGSKETGHLSMLEAYSFDVKSH